MNWGRISVTKLAHKLLMSGVSGLIFHPVFTSIDFILFHESTALKKQLYQHKSVTNQPSNLLKLLKKRKPLSCITRAVH